jgi:hypothetical protein
MRSSRLWLAVPQVLSGVALAVLMLGLFVAAVGHTGGTPLENIQTRAFGAYLGWFALAALAVSQLWLHLEERAERPRCTECSHLNELGARFCASCGRSMAG